MFDKNELFNFIFANKDDDYYTDYYIKMDFDTFLWTELKKISFRYIINIRYTTVEGYILELTGINKNFIEFDTTKRNHIISFSHFKKSSKSVFDNKVIRERSELSIEEIYKYIDKFIDLMLNNENIAFILPIQIFNNLCKDKYKYILKKVLELKVNNRRNIFVICTSLYSSDNDSYFISYDWKFHKDQNKNNSIFFNENLFPEIKNALNPEIKENYDCREAISKLVFPYDLMKKSFGNRMIFCNEITFEKILNIVKYVYLRNIKLWQDISPEVCAAVIYRWFIDPLFKDKYNNLISENINRLSRNIARDISNNDFYNRILEIIKNENIEDYTQWLESQYHTENGVYMTYYGESFQKLKISEYLLRYKRIIIRNNYEFDNEKMRRLYYIIDKFRKPSYQSSSNCDNLPHVYFDNDDISKIFDMLENKRDWNCWDNEAIKLLFNLFDLCLLEATIRCDRDYLNYTGKIIFDKSIEGINYCLENSKKHNLSSVNTEVINNTIQTMREGTIDDIKKLEFNI